MSTGIELAIERSSRKNLTAARLRLAMTCLSGAAQADLRLNESPEWRTAMTCIAKLLNQKAEVKNGPVRMARVVTGVRP